MSQGNPLDARHLIRGLETGDQILAIDKNRPAFQPGGKGRPVVRRNQGGSVFKSHRLANLSDECGYLGGEGAPSVDEAMAAITACEMVA
jgi:hypothetical protein